MRELSFGPLIVAVVFVSGFLPSHAEARNEKAQQVGEDPRTYVVRYKNGDQTIPVTVVLDYKKQTEYVINMNPRTPAKSVTLYDFKQRTIAYKDLKNRECFLGRLTYETLNEETDALNKVQNPVNHTPKVLSLDPQRSALTPTEIRNIAGQRTAVFCRKMNTWLIMPQDSHIIQKRETDEVEERTYHRHGFHTVRYSHYGRETRRRFRNSKRNDSKQLSYENKNTSDISNPEHGISETNSFLRENILPREPSNHRHPSQGREEPLLPSSNSFSLENIPGGSEIKSPLPFVPDRESSLIEQGLGSSFGSDTAGHQHRISERTLDQNHHLPYTESTPFRNVPLDTLYGRKVSNSSENVGGIKHKEQSSALYARSPVFTEDTLESHTYPEKSDLPFPSPGNNSFNSFSPEGNIYNYQSARHPNPLPVGVRLSQIEREWLLNQTLPQSIPERASPEITDSQNVLENPDASTTVLEIPKNDKKFENLNYNQGFHVLIPQTNEDVHDVFEGFYNLKDNVPTDGGYFRNSHFIPSESDQERDFDHSESHALKNYSTQSHSRKNTVDNHNVRWREKAFPYSNTDVTSSTYPPLFTTLINGEVRRVTTPTPLKDLSVITSNRKYDVHSSLNSEPHHEQAANSYERRAPTEPIFTSRHQLESSNTIPSVYLTTELPVNVQNNYGNSNHRSDIPSEIDNGEIVRFNTQTNSESDTQSRLSRVRPSLAPTEGLREAVPLHPVHFQNTLLNYKPDEIVINVEGIPTQTPLGNVAGFQDRSIIRNEMVSRKHTPTLPLTAEKRGEQIFGGTWRSTYPPNVRNPTRRISNNVPKQHSSTRNFHQRQSFVPRSHHLNGNEFPHPPVNTIHQRGRTHNEPIHTHFPRTFEEPHYPLDALPPGVSIHPRHPKAPYADMFQSNMPPSLPQENKFRTVKSHRQRHHRKKNRLSNCCRGSGKTSGSSSSCCRSGGSCCSSHVGKTIPSRTSCCSSTKNNLGQFHPPRRNQISFTNQVQEIRTPDGNRDSPLYTLRNRNGNKAPSLLQDQIISGDNRDVKDFSPQQNRMLVPNDSPQPRRTFDDNRERCLKEKMCRTVYESTQQVIVCRNANIIGCS